MQNLWMMALAATLLGACSAPNANLRPAGDHAALPLLHIALDKRELEQLQRAAAPALANAPDPLPVVHTEGTLATTEAYKRASKARRDWGLMSTLASLYSATRDGRYLERYEHYLLAWLDVYAISGNPIDETDLGHWLLAYRTAGGALAPTTQIRMRAFACRLSERYQQRQPPQRRTTTNNWQSHRVKLAVMGAYVCADPDLTAGAIALFKDQIRDNLLPTGEAVDFFERDALHYVVYSVEPLLEASLFSTLHGRPLFPHLGPQGQSIGRTLQWLAPYARGELTHQEFVKSSVRFDAERAAAGVAGFSGPFDPHKARHAYWLASQLDTRWAELAASLGKPSIIQRAAWMAK